MDVDAAARHEASLLAHLEMFPVRNKLFGILEAARADVEPLQHGLAVAVATMRRLGAVLLVPGIRTAATPSTTAVAFRTVPSDVAEHFLAVIRRIPSPEQQVPQHDLIHVAVFGSMAHRRGRDSLVVAQQLAHGCSDEVSKLLGLEAVLLLARPRCLRCRCLLRRHSPVPSRWTATDGWEGDLRRRYERRLLPGLGLRGSGLCHICCVGCSTAVSRRPRRLLLRCLPHGDIVLRLPLLVPHRRTWFGPRLFLCLLLLPRLPPSLRLDRSLLLSLGLRVGRVGARSSASGLRVRRRFGEWFGGGGLARRTARRLLLGGCRWRRSRGLGRRGGVVRPLPLERHSGLVVLGRAVKALMMQGKGAEGSRAVRTDRLYVCMMQVCLWVGWLDDV